MNNTNINVNEIIGRSVGESTISKINFISKKMPGSAEYVILEYGGKKILGMIENLFRGNLYIPGDIFDPETVEKILTFEGDDYYIRGSVRIIGDIDNFEIPRTPAPPGTRILKADSEILKKIFGIEEKGIRIGTLITQNDVPVFIDANKMISRHLAVLAMTGAGKSNTVALLTDGILKFNGCVLIIDPHSEYPDAEFKNGHVNRISPKLNPIKLSLYELGTMAKIYGNMHIQLRYFRKAWKMVSKQIREGKINDEDFFKSIIKKLEDLIDVNSGDKKSIFGVINKIEDLEQKYAQIFNFNIKSAINQLRQGYANVIDLGTVDENIADLIVSHILQQILKNRKINLKNSEDGLKFPVFIIIEEAHILAPSDRDTDSKNNISKIAREGRKFGVGLCLVSQSPKRLDRSSLSQTNNKIILRLVEPNDQKYVQMASEHLSEDLLSQLPSLNPGEAVVVGLMTKVPALVKINLFEGKLTGGDLDIIKLWKTGAEEKERIFQKKADEVKDLYGG
ncbi:MAG: helicase HerA-like domain-containing protein [Promethearchaeota archaeon]